MIHGQPVGTPVPAQDFEEANAIFQRYHTYHSNRNEVFPLGQRVQLVNAPEAGYGRVVGYFSTQKKPAGIVIEPEDIEDGQVAYVQPHQIEAVGV